MDGPQLIIALLAAAGGGAGVDRLFKLFRRSPEPGSVREFKNANLLELRHDFAKLAEQLIHQTQILTRIEGNAKLATHRLDSRMDEHHERISDLEDFRRRFEGRERPK